MNRTLRRTLALAEVAAGLLLALAAWWLPSRAEVRERAGGVADALRHGGDQLAAVQGQVDDLRRPAWRALAESLSEQAARVAAILRERPVDFATIAALSDSMAGVADGVERWGDALDAEHVAELGRAMGAAADFLEGDLVGSSARSAERLEALAAELKRDGSRFAELLRRAPPDLKAAREVYDALGRFDAGADGLLAALRVEQMGKIKDGLSGMEASLDRTAEQVDKLGSFSYPVVTFRGLKPEVQQKPFWAAGGEIAENLRRSSRGVLAANTELSKLEQTLPKLRDSAEAARGVLAKTREAMGRALEDQGKLEALLRDLPERAAALSERLPAVAGDMAKLLRQASALGPIAATLRKSAASVEKMAGNWPEVRERVRQSGRVLRVSQEQLAKLVARRPELEKALGGLTDVASKLAELMPAAHRQFDTRLAHQAETLGRLRESFAGAGESLPALAERAADVATAARWALALLAATLVLRGAASYFERRDMRPSHQ